MSTSLIVPFNPDGGERERNWSWLRSRYEDLHPGWEIVEGRCDGAWRKGTAVNAAVEASSADILVIADADVLIAPDVLDRAIDLVHKRIEWIQPHRIVYRLSEAATRELLAGKLGFGARLSRAQLARAPRRGPAGGGLIVLRRVAFERVGGIDPRFIGWGGEDISFARALETLAGPRRQLAQPLWHLWHPPMERRLGDRACEENEALAGRYLDASGERERMAALISEGVSCTSPSLCRSAALALIVSAPGLG
jgi:Glycosyl transferase family 21